MEIQMQLLSPCYCQQTVSVYMYGRDILINYSRLPKWTECSQYITCFTEFTKCLTSVYQIRTRWTASSGWVCMTLQSPGIRRMQHTHSQKSMNSWMTRHTRPNQPA